MMTTFTICFIIVVIAVIMLAALPRSEYLNARFKLPGVDFSLQTRQRKR